MTKFPTRILRTVVLAALLVVAGTATAQDQPNIVLVFMDNFGWGEPGFNGGGIVRGAATPRLDRLAEDVLEIARWEGAERPCRCSG